MHRISLVSFTGLVGFFVGACFIESPQPSTFRFACEADDDCGDTQVCDDGLCQQACGAADDLECPNDAPLCFNGHCSSVCPVDEDVCPSPQTCITFEDPSADEPPTSGICGIPCDDARPCGEGNLCFEGACVATCMTDDECGEGESCLANLCIPG